jgi:predicted 2-oxoglutarate/Fe(II)-dependent dioxygenase YbiX
MLACLVLEFDMEPFPEDRQPQWMEFGGVSLLMDDTYVRMKKRVEMDANENVLYPEDDIS